MRSEMQMLDTTLSFKAGSLQSIKIRKKRFFLVFFKTAMFATWYYVLLSPVTDGRRGNKAIEDAVSTSRICNNC